MMITMVMIAITMVTVFYIETPMPVRTHLKKEKLVLVFDPNTNSVLHGVVPNSYI